MPGGGVALIRAVPKPLKFWKNTYSTIVYEAASAPIRQMARNAGESPDVVLEKVKKASANKGLNFRTGAIVPMFDAGIIDPVKVTITALINAASAAGTLITTGHAIIEEG